MLTTSLEISKRLYELSGWDNAPIGGTQWHRYKNNGDPTEWKLRTKKYNYTPDDECYPAYDLGYLLRKLPAQFGKRGSSSAECLRLAKDKNKYLTGYIGVDLVWGFPCEADTPEDAAGLLAIKLFEKGVLK